MKLILKIFLILFSVFCYSQNSIKGIIKDDNNKSIAYANIYIKNTNFGTISNEDGYFEMKIPKDTKHNLLIISALGYKNIEIQIILSEKLKTIILEEEIVLLDEVILGRKLTANQVVEKAFNNYYQNFPEKPFISDGFIRHTERTKTSYKWLIEGAIQVYDPGFNKSNKNTKTSISEIRKSYDNRNTDTIDQYRVYLSNAKGFSYRKAWKKQFKIDDIPKQEIQKAIIFNDNRSSNPSFLFSTGINVLRNYNQKEAILDKKLQKKHTFKIDTIIPYNEKEEVYKIKITPKNPPAKLNKRYGKYLLPFGWIYISSKDYSILEFEYLLVNSSKASIFTKISGSKVRSKFNIKFTKIEGRMYPKYISYEEPRLFFKIASVMDSLATKKTINQNDQYFLKQEILFTEIITKEDEIKTLTSNKIWNDDLFTTRKYNTEFWNTYNILLENKEEEKMRIDLEKNVNLGNQFKQNK